jgi:hypothetical protein
MQIDPLRGINVLGVGLIRVTKFCCGELILKLLSQRNSQGERELEL